MRAIRVGLLLAVTCSGVLALAAAQEPAANGKSAKSKGQPRALDPWDRPTGSIVDQTARYYVWHDKQGWHLRATAKGLRIGLSSQGLRPGGVKAFGPERARHAGPNCPRINADDMDVV